MEEASVPDGVRELCEGCFKGCSSLCRVTSGPSSSLARIGVDANIGGLRQCEIAEIGIPNSVCQLGDGCFNWC